MTNSDHTLGDVLASKRYAPQTKLHYSEGGFERLFDALTELLHDYDPEDAVIRVEPDGGCILCTHGTTPNDKNTGLCPRHKAEKAIKQARGGRDR